MLCIIKKYTPIGVHKQGFFNVFLREPKKQRETSQPLVAIKPKP